MICLNKNCVNQFQSGAQASGSKAMNSNGRKCLLLKQMDGVLMLFKIVWMVFLDPVQMLERSVGNEQR